MFLAWDHHCSIPTQISKPWQWGTRTDFVYNVSYMGNLFTQTLEDSYHQRVLPSGGRLRLVRDLTEAWGFNQKWTNIRKDTDQTAIPLHECLAEAVGCGRVHWAPAMAANYSSGNWSMCGYEFECARDKRSLLQIAFFCVPQGCICSFNFFFYFPTI